MLFYLCLLVLVYGCKQANCDGLLGSYMCVPSMVIDVEAHDGHYDTILNGDPMPCHCEEGGLHMTTNGSPKVLSRKDSTTVQLGNLILSSKGVHCARYVGKYHCENGRRLQF